MYRYDLYGNPVDSSANANIVEQSVFGQACPRPSGSWPARYGACSASPENQAECNTWGLLRTEQHKTNQDEVGTTDENNNTVTILVADPHQSSEEVSNSVATVLLSSSAVPSKSRLRRQKVVNSDPDKQDDERPYIKKPQNAFMLFLEENRPGVMQEQNIRNSAVVNKVMGQMWNTLSSEEQATYYNRASDTRRLHREQHPTWSYRDNYRRKYKQKRKVPRSAASTTESEQDQEPAHDLLEDVGSRESSSVSQTPLAKVDRLRLMRGDSNGSNLDSHRDDSTMMASGQVEVMVLQGDATGNNRV